MDTGISEYHAKFPRGVRWKITAKGSMWKASAMVNYDRAMYARAEALCKTHVESFAFASAEFGVPVELLMACALTESSAKDPETCVRQEPGYISDNETPSRISAGICQLLISAARGIMKNPKIDRAWLFDP